MGETFTPPGPVREAPVDAEPPGPGTIEVPAGDLARLRDADAVLARWGRLRAEHAALRGRRGHAPTHEESVAAWARMDELEAEIARAFLRVRMASDARARGDESAGVRGATG